jgi:hypothetical protein
VNIYTTLGHMNLLFDLLKKTCEEVLEEMRNSMEAIV